MMKKFEKKMVNKSILTSMICNKCKKESSDEWEMSEKFISISHTGGFNSVIDDGQKYDIDLCEHCFKEMFEDIAVKTKVF
jgi:protein-arginine kinase activator protein McsA